MVTSYTYDKSGNRSTETIVYDGSTTVNIYTYDNSMKLLTDVTTKVNNVITERTGYCYDNNGNQLTKTVKTYVGNVEVSVVTQMTNTYNLRNQLIQTQTWGTEDNNGTIVENTYNAEGYRITKEVNGDATYYLYEADKVILEVNKDGKQKARNVYGTNLLIRDVEGESYSYLYNGHADVTGLIASDGRIAATYYYDAFGNILESTGDVDNSILYSGYQYDEETGLYYLNARMYDPKIARFLQEDTYKGDHNDPMSLNLYTYCHNNPIIYWDPTGHFLEELGEFFKDVGKKVVDSGKYVYKRGKSVIKGAGNIAEGMIEPALTWTDLGAGWALNKFGIISDDTYGYYKDNTWSRLEGMSKEPNILRIVTDPLADRISEMLIPFNDINQWIDYREKTLKENMGSFKENLFSVAKPFTNVLNKKNMYNFFLNPEAKEEELEGYATSLWSAGLTVYGLGKAVPIKPSTVNVTIPQIIPGTNGTLQVAGTSISIPSLALEGISANGIALGAVGILGAQSLGGNGDKNNKKHTPDQEALNKLGKEAENAAKKGNPISEEVAKTLDEWADEYNVDQHHKAYDGSGEHMKGGQDHTHIYNHHIPYVK